MVLFSLQRMVYLLVTAKEFTREQLETFKKKKTFKREQLDRTAWQARRATPKKNNLIVLEVSKLELGPNTKKGPRMGI
jgi:hypothetical protein